MKNWKEKLFQGNTTEKKKTGGDSSCIHLTLSILEYLLFFLSAFLHLHMMNQLIPKESNEHYAPTSSVSLDCKSNQVLFDMGNIDPFKESMELQACNDAAVAQISVETEDDVETVSSASYRAIPTSLSLERQSGTDYGEEDIEDIDMDYDSGLPRETQVHLPAMEIVIRNLGILQERQKAQENAHLKPAKERCTHSTDTQDIDYSLEAPIDTQLYNSSLNNLDKNIKDIPVNNLGPREQEEAGKFTASHKRLKYITNAGI